jgi:hypothetical protein
MSVLGPSRRELQGRETAEQCHQCGSADSNTERHLATDRASGSHVPLDSLRSTLLLPKTQQPTAFS